jgi:hypothetical protein
MTTVANEELAKAKPSIDLTLAGISILEIFGVWNKPMRVTPSGITTLPPQENASSRAKTSPAPLSDTVKLPPPGQLITVSEALASNGPRLEARTLAIAMSAMVRNLNLRLRFFQTCMLAIDIVPPVAFETRDAFLRCTTLAVL